MQDTPSLLPQSMRLQLEQMGACGLISCSLDIRNDFTETADPCSVLIGCCKLLALYSLRCCIYFCSNLIKAVCCSEADAASRNLWPRFARQ